ncbi:MAG: adenosylcobalamin-dependent ribonucleoside-diphosphate reductase, partial [Chelatococcus sp.]
FNTGLHWAYGIDGPSQGHFYVDFKTGKLTKSKSSYEHPQPHACFIQGVQDDLVNEGGIMDLWVREARLFKYGSGTGSNFSMLRGEGEKLAGGGRSSGLMSFLKIGDRAAGAIKSGGTTRRAAKMVVVDVDHPDIETYVDWKVKEEQKVAALVTGSKTVKKHMKAVLKACVNCEGEGDSCFDPEKNPALKREVRLARKALVPDNYIKRVIQFARQGYKDIAFDTYDTDWDSEAYLTVSGQNSNNSVSLTDDFLRAVETDGDWNLTARTTGKTTKTLKARDLWEKIGYAAWASADPGLHFNTTMNDWHTCAASGRIRASNPCSEYMFLDDTACNLASANLLQFYDTQTKSFDVAAYEHLCRLWTVVLEISVTMAQFPSREIAELSYEYRTLGLGYANIGGLLMTMGLGYDSDEGRALAGALTAIMTGVSYATSAEMAGELGPFPGYKKNAGHMLRVIRNHRTAAHGLADGYEGLQVTPVPLDHATLARLGGSAIEMSERARIAWDNALALGEKHGYRNAQATVIAPTGTIGLVMDCDTTGIEPDFALVKFKKLAGGGYFKIINRAVPDALRALGYREADIAEIEAYAVGHGSMKQAPGVNPSTLRARGFTDEKIEAVEKGLKSAFDIKFVFNKWTLALPRLLQGRDRGGQRPCLRRDDPRGRPAPQDRALQRLRLRQPLRAHRQALSLGRQPHPHDGGGPALHLGRHLQDHQHAQRRHGRGLQERLHALLEAGAEGERPLPRRLQALAAAELGPDLGRRRGRRGRRRDAGRPAHGRAGHADLGEDRRAHRREGGARPREDAGSPHRLHPEGRGRRPQGLHPHRRIFGRAPRRDLHRHAQGGRGLPGDDEQLRHRGLA